MHHNFRYISDAWRVAKPENDKYYNDATWNVVYVDSHDYAPNGAPEDKRFSGDERTLAENWSLMFTHRGIPCVYYGSEIQFKKGCVIDNGPNTSLIHTGRAYYGGYIKGSAQVTDFAQFTHATGNMAQTLRHPLAQHVQRLNRIRQAVPALRKGQYSLSGCSGSYAFKRRYTDATTDSYALVTISGGATFSNIPNGVYVDCVTGDSQTVTNGTLTVSCSGKGNLRVYVLHTDKTPAPGKIGDDGKYIYASSSVGGDAPTWDGTEEELVNDPTNPQDPDEIQDPCLKSEDQRCAFFTKSSDFGNKIYCYMWFKDGGTTEICGKWPGKLATRLGNGIYRFDIPDDAPAINDKWMIIWNDGSGNQTADLKYYNQGMYSGNNKGNIQYTSPVTLMCEDTPVEDVPTTPVPNTHKVIKEGRLYIFYQGLWYDAMGNRQ
jgi:hypothetical protein